VSRLLPALLLALACAPEIPPPVNDTTATLLPPPDSLLFTLRDSTRVWLTSGRTGRAADGTTCQEHGVRVGEKLVPLLFVREAPRLEDGVLRADLVRDCVRVATYRIDPVTAQPTREGDR
jgi:hypothetical protein